MWNRVQDALPNEETLPNGDDRGVLAYCPNRDESVFPFEIVNTVWFNSHWETSGFTHWMYLPETPKP